MKYGPNPKRIGSLSFARYARYQKAKTVGEALKHGTKLADLLWEFERGDSRPCAFGLVIMIGLKSESPVSEFDYVTTNLLERCSIADIRYR